MVQLHIAQTVTTLFLSIDVTWESLPVLLQEEHHETIYNTTVEHYPFQKGFMFGMYWEHKEMGDSIGSFFFFYVNGVERSFAAIGKSINIKTI